MHSTPGLFILLFCGPDGIRTRDLGLDRAACSATTPRDLASGSLLYNYISVKRRYLNIITYHGLIMISTEKLLVDIILTNDIGKGK